MKGISIAYSFFDRFYKHLTGRLSLFFEKVPATIAYRMKKIELVIEPHKLDDVHHALTAIGVSDATVRAGAASDTRLEIVVSAERAADVIRAFAGPSWRRLIGNAKMFVYSSPNRSAHEILNPARTLPSRDLCKGVPSHGIPRVYEIFTVHENFM